MSITVKIGTVPGIISDYVLDDGSSVAQALGTAGISSDGYTVTVNGTPNAELSQLLSEGSRVLLTKAIKGN